MIVADEAEAVGAELNATLESAGGEARRSLILSGLHVAV
jgi:hypothetical protein